MTWWSRLRRRNELEQDLGRELEFHIAERISALKSTGVGEDEARRRVRQEFGGIEQVKEECRNARGTLWFESTVQDLRYTLRTLRKSPMFTAVAVLTLGLGIGATTAIFSVINGVLLKPLPYPDTEELVAVKQTAPGWSVKDLSASASMYFIYREQSRTFEDIGVYTTGLNSTGYSVNVTGLGEPEHVPALGVTDRVLPILEVAPLIGRSFTRADDSPGSAETVILTYGYWRRKFGGDRSVIGRTIDVDGKPRAIISVLPQRFRFLDKTNLAMLLPMKLNRAKTYLGGFVYGGIARLKPGVTRAQANADVARMLPIVERSFPPPPGFSLKLFEGARIGPNLAAEARRGGRRGQGLVGSDGRHRTGATHRLRECREPSVTTS